MTTDVVDFDHALGLVRTQGKAHVMSLVRLLVRNGYARADVAAVFAFLGQGLSADSVGGNLDWQRGVAQGIDERRRGTFEEFYEVPRSNERRYR
jgi:hypothetical protein